MTDEDDDDCDLRKRTRRYRASIRRRFPRKKTVPLKRLTRRELAAGWIAAGGDAPYERPRTRGECRDGFRPCPFVACKYHLYLDINPETGSTSLTGNPTSWNTRVLWM